MAQLQQILQHHHRVSSLVILVPQKIKGGLDFTLHQGVEQIDHARTIGKAEHIAHIGFRGFAATVGDRLIEQ